MPALRFSGRRIPVTRKAALTSAATVGAAALAFTLVPAAEDRETSVTGLTPDPVAYQLGAVDIPAQRESLEQHWSSTIEAQAEEQHLLVAVSAAEQRKALEEAEKKRKAEEAAAQKKAEEEAEKKRKAEEAAAQKKAEEEAAAQKKREEAEESASRSTEREPVAAAKTYPNNLDGWIREALDIMAANGIPGSYDGLHRNIMRESSGNPNAINDWDINWQNGTPSIGLLQVIQPTFDAYHVAGTPHDLYDPVANIVAAANYAWDRYGSIDNVDGPY